MQTAMNQNASTEFNVEKIREDFPTLKLQVYGKPLVYLDNSATAQKPQVVIDRMNAFYSNENSNVHRGLNWLSQKATAAYEESRVKVQKFLNAKSLEEIIYTKGTTDGINLVAHSFGRSLKPGDEILITAMEHHSNIVPWQLITQEKGATLKVVPMNERGELIMEEFDKLLSPKTKLVSVVHVSNALGTINPVETIIQKAHKVGSKVLLDGAQAVPHLPIDVQALDCDFYAFSGHKLFGPTGIGILYGKKELLNALPPYQGGGDMIRSVTFEKTTYNDLPYKFEAGTPNIAGAIGLGAAIDYVHSIDWDKAMGYEDQLLAYATETLSKIPGVKLIGTAAKKVSVVSFVIDKIHPHDIATFLDQDSIAIRAGHHCAQPVMDFFHVPATVRASLAFYNTREEIDALAAGIKRVIEFFK